MSGRAPAFCTPARRRENIRTHEQRNALHLLVGLLEMAGQGGTTGTDRISESPVRTLLVGKTVAAAQWGIRLTVGEGSPRRRCRDRSLDLVTIAGNLVDNAVDALLAHRPTPPDEPRIEVDLRERAGLTELRVSDNGPGVPPELRHWIFTEGASTKPRRDGRPRGLGLALVSDLVSGRGGTVTVDGRAGGGAVFTVRMPPAVPVGERRAP
ncbi:sensor histidine kinase [Streptomyces sp. NPDC056061]|uniref:sensor histidine kinase n=1 Tax=Streptomyces sp. NPDC056061 TaxID=3345700 RepID=UPI0035DB8A08